MIMQTNGAGFCIANSAYLDIRGDCVTCVRWPIEKDPQTLSKNEESKEGHNEGQTKKKKDSRMVCVVTAAGVALV